MKNKFVFLSLILVFALLCTSALAKPALTNKKVSADSLIGPHGQHVIVVGKGEVEVEPDTVKVSFGLKHRDESLLSGQAKIRENVNTIINKIKENNKDVEVYTNYLSSYPVFENGMLAYQFDCCLVAKSSDVENYTALVDAIAEAGSTNIHSTSFLLTNKEEAYIQALVKAKENAETKIKAIYDNAELIGLKEEATYNYCEGNRGEKIKVTAKVNAFYKVPQNDLAENSVQDDEARVAETLATAQNSALSTKNEHKARKPLNKTINKNFPRLQKSLETSNQITNTLENNFDGEVKMLENNAEIYKLSSAESSNIGSTDISKISAEETSRLGNSGTSKINTAETSKLDSAETSKLGNAETLNPEGEETSKATSEETSKTNNAENMEISKATNQQNITNQNEDNLKLKKQETLDSSEATSNNSEQETVKNESQENFKKTANETAKNESGENSKILTKETTKGTETANGNTPKNLVANKTFANKINKYEKQNAGSRKIIDADGNVVIELL